MVCGEGFGLEVCAGTALLLFRHESTDLEHIFSPGSKVFVLLYSSGSNGDVLRGYLYHCGDEKY